MVFFKPKAAQEERKVIANAGTLTVRAAVTASASGYSPEEPAVMHNLEGGVLNWLSIIDSDSLLLRNHGTLLLKGTVHRVFNEGPAAVAELGGGKVQM